MIEPLRYIDSMLGKGTLLYDSNFPLLYKYLGGDISPTPKLPTTPPKRVKLYCNWCNSTELLNLWSKMIKISHSIVFVEEEPIDFHVVINATSVPVPKNKTILFRMEPRMDENPVWGEWRNIDEKEFVKVFRHQKACLNVLEWHLGKTYLQLCTEKIEKVYNILSTVLSSKYNDPGQVKRIDFVKFLEKKGLEVHVYGDNKWEWKEYRGALPYHNKDNAILPYKYTFNAENHSIPNYCTEKLIDGILGECLTFYWGCFNINEYIDERAYVYLELVDFQKDYETVMKAISEDWHLERLPYIKQEKERILNELQFFPTLNKVISNLKK